MTTPADVVREASSRVRGPVTAAAARNVRRRDVVVAGQDRYDDVWGR